MTSASSASAKLLFADSKSKLAERVQLNVNSLGSVLRQVQKGSKSNEALSHAAKNFAAQEHVIDSFDVNLRKLQVLVAHLGYQYDSVESSCQLIPEVKDLAISMLR